MPGVGEGQAQGPARPSLREGDGTATAGADYTATSGTLTFNPGDVAKSISVPILDDAIDDGDETMTLTLSNASNTRIADGTATGTIESSDPLQQAWIAKFGRTVASQVIEAVSDRLSDGRGRTRSPSGASASTRTANWRPKSHTPPGKSASTRNRPYATNPRPAP